MKFIQHPSNNCVLGAPKAWDHQAIECHALPITRSDANGCPVMVSFWRPSADELADLAAGGAVALWIYGSAHPPVSLQVEPLADGQAEMSKAAPVHPLAGSEVEPLKVPFMEEST
jgi:hypothetical protein